MRVRKNKPVIPDKYKEMPGDTPIDSTTMAFIFNCHRSSISSMVARGLAPAHSSSKMHPITNQKMYLWRLGDVRRFLDESGFQWRDSKN